MNINLHFGVHNSICEERPCNTIITKCYTQNNTILKLKSDIKNIMGHLDSF